MFRKCFKKIRGAFAVLLASLFLLTFCCQFPEAVCASSRYDSLRNDITGQLISSYAENTRSDKTDTLLRELRNIDPQYSMIWEQILSYWDNVNQDDFVKISSQTSSRDELPEDNSLCIVILGFALNPDGTMKDELVSRLQAGLDLALMYPEAYVLVTGGGTAKDNPKATEADCMAGWLTENGIADNRLIIENLSRTTVENAMFSYDILKNDYPQIKNMAIVTSDYHVPLGCLLFQSCFLLNQYPDFSDNSGKADLQIISNSGVHIADIRPFSVKQQADKLSELVRLTEQR